MNASAPEPDNDDGAGFVTTTFCAPAVPAGVVHAREVEDANTTDVHDDPPTVTVAPDTNPVPVIVTGVPPAVVPDGGDTDDTVGATADPRRTILPTGVPSQVVKYPTRTIFPSACTATESTPPFAPVPVVVVNAVSRVQFEFTRTTFRTGSPFQVVNSPPRMIFPSACSAAEYTRPPFVPPMLAPNSLSTLPVESSRTMPSTA